MARSKALAPLEDITRSILILRSHRVILDADLAALYGVPTKRLNEQVRRNAARFALNGLGEGSRLNTVEFGKILIEQHPLRAQHDD